MTILNLASDLESQVKPPHLLTDRWRANPPALKLHESHSIKRIKEKAMQLSKPCIALLGPYSSGKSFVINFLLRGGLLKTAIAPTTACLTVLRHLSERPESWSQHHCVFVLRPGVDIRTTDAAAVASGHELSALPQLTTYPAAENYQTVVVFLTSDVLRDASIIDVPGVGTFTEGHEVVDEDGEAPVVRASEQDGRLSREHQLQRLAIQQADAYILLNAVAGQQGAFADRATAELLFLIANNATRFANDRSHRNMLLVGSWADPTKRELRDSDQLLESLRQNVTRQVEYLPTQQQASFDVAALRKRITLFYALDDYEIQTAIDDLASDFLRYNNTASRKRARDEAERQFEERRARRERTEGLFAGVKALSSYLLMMLGAHRMEQASGWLLGTIDFFSKQRAQHERDALHHREYEDLSKWFDKDAVQREAAWNNIEKSYAQEVEAARMNTLRDFESRLSWWSDSDNVYRHLQVEFGDDKERTKLHAAESIQHQLDLYLTQILTQHTGNAEAQLRARFKNFDEEHLRGPAKANPLGATVAPAGGSLHVSIQSISSADTFSAVVAGVAGTTALAAVGGSVIAQIAMTKLVAISVGVAGTIGLGSAWAGLLAGIPVWGWAAAGLAALGYGVFKLFAWRKAMASSIAKSLAKAKADAVARVGAKLKEIFSEMDRSGLEILRETKALVDGRIADVHQIGRGHVRSDDLLSASTFYKDIETVANDALTSLASARPA